MTQLSIEDPAIRQAIRDRVRERIRARVLERVGGGVSAVPDPEPLLRADTITPDQLAALPPRPRAILAGIDQFAQIPQGEIDRYNAERAQGNRELHAATVLRDQAAQAKFAQEHAPLAPLAQQIPQTDADFAAVREMAAYTPVSQPEIDAAVRDLYATYPEHGDRFNAMEPRLLTQIALERSSPAAARPMTPGSPGADTAIGEFGRALVNATAQQFDVPNAPLVGPWLHQQAQVADLQAPPQGFSGFAGQAVGGLTGMASPNNWMETAGSVVAGGVAGKLAAPLIKRVAARAGTKVAGILEHFVSEASEEATFAMIQQAGQEDWENDPAGALQRTATAMGIGGAVGGVMGAGFAAKGGHGPEGSVFDRIDAAKQSQGTPRMLNPQAQQRQLDALAAMRPNSGASQNAGNRTYDRGTVENQPSPTISPLPGTVGAEIPQAAPQRQQTPPQGDAQTGAGTPHGMEGSEVGATPAQVPTQLRRSDEVQVGQKSVQVGQKSGQLDTTRPDEGRTVPETPESLTAQIDRLSTGERAAVLIPKGTTDTYPAPKGIRSVLTSAGRVMYDPAKLKPDDIKAAVREDRVGDILGYGTPRKPADAAGVVVVRDERGNEIQAVATNEAEAPGVIAAAQRAASRPGDQVTVETAEETIGSRVEGTQGRLQGASTAQSEASRPGTAETQPFPSDTSPTSGPSQGEQRGAQRSSVGSASGEASPNEVQSVNVNSPLKLKVEVDAKGAQNVEGKGIVSSVVQDLTALSYQQLRAEAKRRGLNPRGTSETLRQRLAAASPETSATFPGPSEAGAGEGPASSGTRAVGETATSGNRSREPWEMTREDYAESEYQKKANDPNMRTPTGISRLGTRKFYDIQNGKKHRNAVAQAIAAGKITSHPDYPDLAPNSSRKSNSSPDTAPDAAAARTTNRKATNGKEEGQTQAQGLLNQSDTAKPVPAEAGAGVSSKSDKSTNSRGSPTGVFESRLRAIEDRAKERIRTRRSPTEGRRGSGSTTLVQDAIDAAVMVAVRAARLSVSKGRQLSAIIKEVREELSSKADPKQVRRIARGLIRDISTADPNGTMGLDAGKLEYAVGKLYEAEKPTISKPAEPPRTSDPNLKRSMRRQQKASEEGFAAGEKMGEYKSKYDRRGAAYKAGQAAAKAAKKAERDKTRAVYTYAQKAAKAAYSAGRADERVVAQAKLADTMSRLRGKQASVDGIRAEAVRIIQEHAPLRIQGKYLAAVRDATTLGRVGVVIRRVQRDLILDEGRSLVKASRRVGALKLRSLEPEWRTDAQAALTAIRDATKVLRQNSGKVTIQELMVARDELKSAINAIKSALHQQKNLDKVRIGGEVVEAAAIRQQIGDQLGGRKEIPKDDKPGPRDTGFLSRVGAKRTNWDTLMRTVDGFKSGGAAGRLFQRVLGGRRESLRLHHGFEDLFGKIVTANGFKSTGDFLAQLSGTLGPKSQKFVNVKVGEHGRISLGEAAYLHAAMSDAGFRARIEAGQKLQFRADAMGEPFTMTMADLQRVSDAIPANVRAIIDQAKDAYDSHYFSRLSAVHKRINGYHLEKVPGYWGIKLNRNFSEGRGTPNSWRGQVIRALEESGFMQERTGPAKAPISIGDFGTDILLRSRSSATVVGKAEITKMLTRIFLHPDVVTKMSRTLGSSAVERMERRISLYSGGDLYREATDNSIRKIMSLWARGKTQNWVWTWARNAMSGVPRIARELGLSGAIRGAVTPTWGAFGDLMRYSPEARERWAGGGLSSFYHGSGVHESGATFRDSLAAVMKEAGSAAGNFAMGRSKRAFEATKGAGKAWESLLDTIRVGNFFDATPAIVAYKAMLSRAPTFMTPEARKAWAARHAMRAFERTANTATIEYANDIQLNARENTAVAMFTQFTGDTAKTWNMLYQAAHEGKAPLAKTVIAIAAGIAGSAAITAGRKMVLGDEKEKVKGAAMERAAQEVISLIPGVGNTLAQLAPRTIFGGGSRATSPELETPITTLVNSAWSVVQDAMDAYDRIGDKPKKGKLTAEDKFSRAAKKLFFLWGEASGLPVQYINDAWRASDNYQK